LAAIECEPITPSLKWSRTVTTLDKEQARQGETRHRMRYVLGISLALAVVAMVVIVVSFV
jgi:hypothetical protein